MTEHWRLIQVMPAELHLYWPLVRPGIEQACRRARAACLPEDVYGLVMAGRALLYVGYLEREYAGLMVLTTHVEPFSYQKSLLVWVAYGRHRQAFELALGDAENIARRLGFSRILIQSPRPGMARRLSGYAVKDVTYERII